MSQEYKFTGNERATTIEHNNAGCIVVTYHNTQVVSIDKQSGFITFDTGGYETATTRRRMNQACNTFALPFRAYIEDFALYVENLNTGKVYSDFPLLVRYI